MKKEDFGNLSYASRKDLVDLRDYCASVLQGNDDKIYKDDTETVLHQFRDKTGKFTFNIQFSKPNEAAGSNYYQVYSNPINLTSNIGGSSQQNLEQIKISFNNWLHYITKMHEVTEEYFNPYSKFYNEEFKDFFINNDEDSATSPFDLDRQEVLYLFLTYAESQVLKSEEITEDSKLELVEDINKLKENIPNLTKKVVVSALSKIAQKIKKLSNNLFHLVFDVLKKEVIKNILYKGAGYIPNAIKHIASWLHHLQ